MDRGRIYLVDLETSKDIRWWHQFLEWYKGHSIMWMDQFLEPDEIISMDACLTGLGGICGDSYFHITVPSFLQDDEQIKIPHLEFWAILVECRTWGGDWRANI